MFFGSPSSTPGFPFSIATLAQKRSVSSQRELFLRHLGQTNDFPLMLEIERADGCYQYDVHGKPYLDLISGIAVANIGHNHPVVKNALNEQLEKHLHVMVYGEFVQSPQVKYAKWLCDRLPSSLDCTYFTNSGAEAVEAALKLAKRLTGRTKMVSCNDAYHGSTHGALSLAGGEELKSAFRPLLPDCHQIPYDDVDALEEIDEQTACFVVEPVQGEKGGRVPSDGYLAQVRKRCTEVGAVLVFDEIQTGFGRTGSLFALEDAGVVPDILALGKALGGGMPLGAIVSSIENLAVFKNEPVLGHITTFGGHPMSCAAGWAANNWLLQSGLIASISEKEALIRNELSDYKVNGKGLLLSVELGSFDELQRVCNGLIGKGFITDWFLYNMESIRLAPPLIITEEQIKEFTKAFKALV